MKTLQDIKKSLFTAVWLVVFLFVPLTASSHTGPWSLEQCVDTALAKNRNIKMQQLTGENRRIAYEQARMDLLPNLNASLGQNFGFGRTEVGYNQTENTNSMNTNLRLSAGITLFDGLRMKYNIDAKKADLQASEADLEKIKEDIVLSVSTAFLQALMNKELLRITEEQLAVTREAILQRKALVATGRMAEGELYELQAQEAKEELSRVRAENTLKLSLLDLAQILDLDDFRNMDVLMPEHLTENKPDLLLPEDVYNKALQQRPEVRSSEYKLRSSEKNVAIARSGYYPTLSFYGTLGSDYFYSSLNKNTQSTFEKQLSNNLGSSVGLSLNIPIFNKFETRNRVRTAKLSVENNRLEMENVKLALRKTIEQAYQNAVAAQARWTAAGESEKAAQEAFRFAQRKYDAGRATQYEFFQAKNNLSQVLLEKTQAKYEYIFRTMILERYNR